MKHCNGVLSFFTLSSIYVWRYIIMSLLWEQCNYFELVCGHGMRLLTVKKLYPKCSLQVTCCFFILSYSLLLISFPLSPCPFLFSCLSEICTQVCFSSLHFASLKCFIAPIVPTSICGTCENWWHLVERKKRDYTVVRIVHLHLYDRKMTRIANSFTCIYYCSK